MSKLLSSQHVINLKMSNERFYFFFHKSSISHVSFTFTAHFTSAQPHFQYSVVNVTTILDSTDLGIFKPSKWTFVREYKRAEACWNDPSGEVKRSWLQIPTLTLTRYVCLVESLYLDVFNCQNTLQESSQVSQDSYNIRQKIIIISAEELPYNTLCCKVIANSSCCWSSIPHTSLLSSQVT